MPQSLVKNYIHLIFSTKNRKPLIKDSLAPELYIYLGGITNNLECHPVEIGGIEDHIHVLFLLSQKTTLMRYIEAIKSNSSKWMKSKGVSDFYWQSGYGAFSVNPIQVDSVRQYILNQKEHHKKRTFQEEYRLFLKKYQVSFDERYVWG